MNLRSHLTFANVASAIALFLALSGGVVYAANTVGSADVIDDSLQSVDLKDNAAVRSADVVNDTVSGGGLAAVDLRPDTVGASEVVNGALNDEDIGQSTYHFSGDIGTVGAQSCVYRTVAGINAQADHLLLTPNAINSGANLDYGVEYLPDGRAGIRVCNPSTFTVDDGSTTFNLLVIDAE